MNMKRKRIITNYSFPFSIGVNSSAMSVSKASAILPSITIVKPLFLFLLSLSNIIFERGSTYGINKML